MRATDIVARLSGDEFAVLMPQTDTEGALQLGEDLRAQVAESARPAPEAGRGNDQRRRRDVRRRELRRLRGGADRRRPGHVPGQGGRPRPDFASSGAEEEPLRALAAADDDGEDPQRAHPRTSQPGHSQSIHSLGSGSIKRYELLLRMMGEDGELLPAASFIEAAERSGMMQELDRWVVARALELLGERERDGKPVSLHVNLSGASLSDVSVLEFIERRLDEGDADPARCTFEITATAGIGDLEAAGGFADRLTEFGCQVAIDDYGAGIGPFHYLKEFPFDVIKIDGEYVKDMPRSTPTSSRSRRWSRSPAGSARRRSLSTSRTTRRLRCSASSASTWRRASTWAGPSPSPRRWRP